jgi:hypothetical protein
MKTRYRVVGSQPINVASGYYVCGDLAVLTPDEAVHLQRAGAVTPHEDAPASAGRSHSRNDGRAASTPAEGEE